MHACKEEEETTASKPKRKLTTFDSSSIQRGAKELGGKAEGRAEPHDDAGQSTAHEVKGAGADGFEDPSSENVEKVAAKDSAMVDDYRFTMEIKTLCTQTIVVD